MAAGRWRIEGAGGVWLIRGDARAAALAMPGEALSREIAATRVDAWFPEGWGGAGTPASLASIVRALEGAFAGSEMRDAVQLKALLRRALRDGRVTALKPGLGAPKWDAPAEAEPVAQALPVLRERLEWIQVELVDEKGKPVPAAEVLIELPNGSVRRGSTDGAGRLRLEGIEGGMCRIQFPKQVVVSR